jgi:hypothetical protein
MGHNTNNSQQQQFSKKPTPQTASTNATKTDHTRTEKKYEKFWTTFTHHSPKIKKSLICTKIPT